MSDPFFLHSALEWTNPNSSLFNGNDFQLAL